MVEDELLKLKFKAGRADALQRIYEKYRDYLLTLAMALLNDAGAAEDVVHDVFVSFAQSCGGLRLRGSLKGYLSTCVLNRSRDHYRARKRRQTGCNESIRPRPDSASPDGRMLSDEQSQHVAAALAQLSDEQREVIALHLNAQMTFRQIARARELPLTTVRGRYRHGINRLRSILNGRLRNEIDP
jgi:RNA polymerase sigma-70 factor (ECF subfamily)